MKSPYIDCIFRASYLTCATSGYNSLLATVNWRLRSLPARLVRLLPQTTPSGLAIGMIKKFTRFLRSAAYLDVPVRNVIKPWSIWELFDSAGCHRPVIKIFFFYLSLSWLVMWRRGMSIPDKLLPRADCLTHWGGRVDISFKSLLKVKGMQYAKKTSSSSNSNL